MTSARLRRRAGAIAIGALLAGAALPSSWPGPAALGEPLGSVTGTCVPGPVPATTTTTLPTGTLPTGTLPTGTLPTGTLPTGTLPTGTAVTGTATTTATGPAGTTTTLPAQAAATGFVSQTTGSTTPAALSGGASTVVPMTTTTARGLLTATASTTAPGPLTATASTATPVPAPPPTVAYDLVTSRGDVQPFGGAGFYGSRVSQGAPTAIIGGASTVDGRGYWLASATGSVYTYGDATGYGSPRSEFGPRRVRAFAATADAQGYWAVTPGGTVMNFGDAPFCGSAAEPVAAPITAIASTPDGEGYWLVATDGTVDAFGDAPDLSPGFAVANGDPIVTIASTPDGEGYWLASAGGAVYGFGDATSYGDLAGHPHSGKVVALVPSGDGAGYWVVTTTGRVYRFGDAPALGSDIKNPPRRPSTVVAALRTLATTTARYVPLPHATIGYDVSNYQCRSSHLTNGGRWMPRTSAISIIEVAGWLNGSYNPCLESTAAWAVGSARATGASYELYLFLNAPGADSASTRQGATGPRGTCDRLGPAQRLPCRAYNYGFNGARAAVAYAGQRHVHAVVWWVDVEDPTLSRTLFSDFAAGAFWSRSRALNAATVQGAFDALRGAGLEVGIYSSSLQYARIVGRFVPRGERRIPLWIAGVPWTRPPYTMRSLPSPTALRSWCAGTAVYTGTRSADRFARGVPWILQETPGVTTDPPFGLDPNYTC